MVQNLSQMNKISGPRSSLELIEQPTAFIAHKEAVCAFSAHLDMWGLTTKIKN